MKAMFRLDRRFTLLLAFLVVAAAGAALFSLRSQPYYQDSFASGKAGEWHAYGGSWALEGSAIQNNSDERGAKLVTGSSNWGDYKVEADVLLLGQDGDAGIIVRSADEEKGVDSYSGYYVGLRDRDNTVTIGRADHGWMEYQAKPVAQPIQPFRWYHLKIVAVRCQIAALAEDSPGSGKTVVAMRDANCMKTGRIGLRSYSSGGLWKRVRVTPASPADLGALVQGAEIADSPRLMQTEAGFNAMLPYRGKRLGPADMSVYGHTMDIHTPSLGGLRYIAAADRQRVTVRGSVVLTSPVLYIQDSSGGIAVDTLQPVSTKIGDEVEVTGIVDPRSTGVTLRGATAHLLWAKGPAPPLSVTASQAATGAFDGMLVEIEGRLQAKTRTNERTVVLELQNGQQVFRAILKGERQSLALNHILVNSLLRLRGVCVADPAYTENLTSFALLLRSDEDVAIVSGPPWWDKRQLLELALVFVIVIVIMALIYLRAERWRMAAVLEERSRMAREIHDTLAQGFAGVALQLESALYGPEQKVATEPVVMALRMARLSRREAHRSIAALRTLHVDQPLESMLRKVLLPQVGGTKLELVFSSSGTPRRLSSECEGHILRVAQEAVANAVQHAHATRITFALTFEAQALRLQIDDDGRGFDVSSAPAPTEGHFGITGMKERAAGMRGNLAITSDSHGTKVSLLVPIPRTQFWKSLRSWIPRFGRLVGT